ncbi:MAG: hypothetical protein WA880_13025 [Ornithinimicrobium sp.]
MGIVADVIGGLGFAFLLVGVHEYGHYWTGRMLGVPADCIRVELGGNPPHVALRDGERWLAPMDELYAEVFQRHRPGTGSAWTYIAGGVIGESFFAVALIGVLARLGAGEVAVVLAWVTAALFAIYAAGDLLVSLGRRSVSGDWSAMYAVQRPATLGLLVAGGAVKAVPLFWLTS